MTAPPFQPPAWSMTMQVTIREATKIAIRDPERGDGCALSLGPMITAFLSQTAEDYLRHLLNVREGRRIAAASAERRERLATRADDPPLTEPERAALAAAVIDALSKPAVRRSEVLAFQQKPRTDAAQPPKAAE